MSDGAAIELRPLPCEEALPHGLTWREVEDLGRVVYRKDRGWCVDFRSVQWPGREKPRRVTVVWAKGYGRLDSQHAAVRAQLQIQADYRRGTPLWRVLSEYIREVPEDTVLHRWRHEFLPEKQRQHDDGALSTKRLRELEQYEQRGHLAFWAESPLDRCTGPNLTRWLHWLRALRKPDGTPRLRAGAIRHLMADFGTFLRFEFSMGSLDRLPVLPEVQWEDDPKDVPRMEDVRRILAAIPDPKRGLWMARSLAGLRPSEARRLDVREYDFATGELHIPGAKSTTKKGRPLPIRAVVPELDAWICAHRRGAMGASPLFENPDAYGKSGGRWKQHAERNCWRAACAAAGVEYVEPNAGGRHAFITHEIDSGTLPYAVQHWVGHSTLATTDRYKKRSAVAMARLMRPAGERRKAAEEK